MSLLDTLLTFTRLLRRAGLDSHAGRTTEIVQALAYVNLQSRDEVYHTCRAILVYRRDQIAIFDVAFDAFWRLHIADLIRNRPQRADAPEGQNSLIDLRDVVDGDGSGAETSASPTDPAPVPLMTWSDSDAVANRDFAEFTADELADARRALSRLAWSPGERRTGRWIRGRGPRVDLRRAIAESLRTGGDVVRLPRRRRRIRPRALVVLCDVSGSM